MAKNKDQFYDLYDDIEKSFNQIKNPDLEEDRIDDEENLEKENNSKVESIDDDSKELDDSEISEDNTSEEELSEEDDKEKTEEEIEDVEGREEDVYTHMKNKPSVDDEEEPVRQIEGKTKLSEGSRISDDLFLDKKDRAKKPDEEVDMSAQVEAEEEKRAFRAKEKEKYKKYREKELRHRQINEELYKDAEKAKEEYYRSSQSGDTFSGVNFKKDEDDYSFELERTLDNPSVPKVSEKNKEQSKDDKEKEKNSEKFSNKFIELNNESKQIREKNKKSSFAKNTFNSQFVNPSYSESSTNSHTRAMFYNNSISNDGILLSNIPNNDAKRPIDKDGQVIGKEKEKIYDKGFSTDVSDTMKVRSDRGVNKDARVYENGKVINKDDSQSVDLEKKKSSQFVNYNKNKGPNRLTSKVNSIAYSGGISSVLRVTNHKRDRHGSQFNNRSFAMDGTLSVKPKDGYAIATNLTNDYYSADQIAKRAKKFESQGIVNDTVRQSIKFHRLKGDLYTNTNQSMVKKSGGFSSTASVKRRNHRINGTAGRNFYSNSIASRYAVDSMKEDPFSSLSSSEGYFKSSYRNIEKNYSYQIGYSYKGIGSSSANNKYKAVNMKNIHNDTTKNARLYEKLKGKDPYGFDMINSSSNMHIKRSSLMGASMLAGRKNLSRYFRDDALSNDFYNLQAGSALLDKGIGKVGKSNYTKHTNAAANKFAKMQGTIASKKINMRLSGKGVYDINTTKNIIDKNNLSTSSGLVQKKLSKNDDSKLKKSSNLKDPRYHKEESRAAVSNDRGKISIVRKENLAGIIANNDKLSGVKASKRKQEELLKKNRDLKAGKARHKASLFGKSIEEQLEDFENVKKSHEYTKGKDGVIRLGKNSDFDDPISDDGFDIFGNKKEKLDEFGNPIVGDGMKTIPGFKGRVGNKNDFLGQKTINSAMGKNSKMRVGNIGPLPGKMRSVGLTKGNAIVGNFMSQTGKTYGKKYDNPGGTFMTMPQMPKIKSPGPSIGKGFSGLLGGAVAIGGVYQCGRYYNNTLLSTHEVNWHNVQADIYEEPGNRDSDFYTEVAKKMIFARQKCYYEMMMGREPSAELKQKARNDLVPLVKLENRHIREVTLDGTEYSKDGLEFDNVKEWTEDKLSKAVGKPVVLVGKKAKFRYVDEDWRTLIGEDKFILQSNSDIVFPDGTGGPLAPASFFGNGGALGSLRGADNAQKIWNALKDLGYSNAGIAGIMGNLMLESGLDPDIQEIGHSQQGYGLAQWTSPERKAGLRAYANSKGVPVSDLQMQVEYLDLELRRDLPGLYNYLKTTDDYVSATDRFMNEYERPGIPARGQRQSFASEIWGKSRSLELDKDDDRDSTNPLNEDNNDTTAFNNIIDSVKEFLMPTSYADPILDPDDPDSETNRFAEGIEKAEKRKREDSKYKVNGDEKVMTVNDSRTQKYIFTPWSRITRQGSDQLKLKQKGESYTSDGYGMIDGRFAVAVTPEYGKIGDKIDAYLDDGTKIPSIIVDIKNPADDTYEAVGHELSDGTLNVLEFYTNWEGPHSNPGEPGSGNRSEWSGKGVEKIVNLNDNYLGNTPGGSDGMEFGDQGANSGGTGADGVGDDTTLSAAVSMDDEEKAGQILFLREMLGLGSIGGFYKFPDVLDEYLKYILDQQDFAMTGDDAKITPNIDFEYVTVNETFDRYEDDGNGNKVFKKGKKYVDLEIKNNVQCNLSYLEQHEKNFNKWDLFSRKYGDKIPQSYIALHSSDFEEIFNIKLEPQGYASSGSYITAGFAGSIDFNEVTGIPYLDFAIAVANDDRHGYSQGPARDSLVSFDCSSLVYYSLQQTMFPQLPNGAFTTHNMGGKLMELGFQRYSGAGPFQVGDILVNSQTHTEMVVGIAPSGRPITVGAKSSETGGIYGQTGDQTGREITVAENYSSWESIYRPPKAMMNAIEQQNKETERKKKIKEEKEKKKKKEEKDN